MESAYRPVGAGPAFSRQLIDAILAFVGDGDLLAADDLRPALERQLEAAGPDAVKALATALTMERGWGYYPPDPIARRIHHYLAPRFLAPGSTLSGAERLAAIESAPIVFVSNHLSYADANAMEVLLHAAGLTGLAARLTALAGPKVYSSRQRRFSSLCFGTIKVPQSSDVASGEAAMSPRAVAIAARRAIQTAQARLAAGDVLMLFGEGTRSRTATMQPLLPAATRYLDAADLWIVAVGLVGPENLFPVDGATVRPAKITATIGTPVRARDLQDAVGGNRHDMADTLGTAIAELLPPAYRGVYART